MSDLSDLSYQHLTPHHGWKKKIIKQQRLRAQRGVTVFVVMMAIVLLSGAGTWAMYAAGLTNEASGYARAAAQSLYVAEMGVVAGNSYLSVPGYADANFAAARNSQAADTPDACWSAADPESGDAYVPFCKSIGMQDLNSTLNAPLLDLAGPYNSLSPETPAIAAGIDGMFVFEMSEPRPVTLPGEPLPPSGLYQRVTLTSYGVVRPGGTAGICSADEQNAVATMMGMRAHMIVGPLSSQKK